MCDGCGRSVSLNASGPGLIHRAWLAWLGDIMSHLFYFLAETQNKSDFTAGGGGREEGGGVTAGTLAHLENG